MAIRQFLIINVLNRNPKVSIIIPVYNGSDFLSEAIESALAQSYTNIEILVINDGSNDGGSTEDIALSYRNRIRYFSKENGGVGSALNLALKYATGEYISWLSHDDLYTNDKIETQVLTLRQFGNDRAIIYSDYDVFFSDSTQSVLVKIKALPPDRFRYSITIDSLIHGCTLLIPITAFEESGCFNEALRTTQDYDLWFRMAEDFEFIHIPYSLVKTRRHSAQGSLLMAEVVFLETNDLKSDFIRKLSPDEIKRATGESSAVGYARIAAAMWRYNLLAAGKVAASLAIKNLKEASMRDRARVNFIVIKEYSRYFTLKCLKMITTPKLRSIGRGLF